MELPLYRKSDQVIFIYLSKFIVGTVDGIQSEGESWKYLIAFTLNTSNKRDLISESEIKGVLFTTSEKLECEGRGSAEDSINLD